ncbi:hypothetical protein KR054_011147 [Drosophila jambulina]|nr:hypothetical protein KR054_011147 [Drosophila jambulina]
MTSAWVLIIASVLHFGMRRSCFLNTEQLPMLPDTLFARHIAYCAMLHFLYDQELLPARYRRRMGLLIGFLVELVLGVAFMEVLGQWLWFRVEHMVHRCLMLGLRTYGGGLNTELSHYLEKAFMRGVMTSLAGLLWLNAYAATEPAEPQVTAANSSMARQKRRPLAKRSEQTGRRIKGQDKAAQQDQQKQKLKQKLKQKMKLMLKQKAEQNRKQLQEQGKQEKEQEQQQQAENPELPVPEEAKLSAPSEEQQDLAVLATTSDC